MKTCFLLVVEGDSLTRGDLLCHLPAGVVLQEFSIPQNYAAAQKAELQLDAARRCVHKGGSQIALTQAEYRLLFLLASQPGRVWGKEQLYRQLWQQQGGSSARAIWNLVYRLRRKIEDDPAAPHYLRTAGGGYQLVLKP